MRRLGIERQIANLEPSSGPWSFEALVRRWLEASGEFTNIRSRSSGSQDGRDVDSVRGSALWYFECKRFRDSVGIEALAPKLIQTLTLPPSEIPDAWVVVATSEVSSQARDLVSAWLGIAHIDVFFWDAPDVEEMTPLRNLLLSNLDLTIQHLKRGGCSLSHTEVEEARRARETSRRPGRRPFFSLSSGPSKRRSHGQIPAASRLLDLFQGDIDSLGPTLGMVRRRYQSLPLRERRRIGSFSDFLQEVVIEGLRQQRRASR